MESLLNEQLVITAQSAGGCETRLTVPVPNCNCPELEAPQASPTYVYCPEDGLPAITATAAPGLQVRWYDGPSLADCSVVRQPLRQVDLASIMQKHLTRGVIAKVINELPSL